MVKVKKKKQRNFFNLRVNLKKKNNNKKNKIKNKNQIKKYYFINLTKVY